MSAANVTPVLDKEKIRTLIPHAGAMVLLDSVRQWTPDFIECDTLTHRNSDNPLRFAEKLSAAVGIEYSAQAVAVHGALCAVANNAAPRVGYLAVLSDIRWYTNRLDTYPGVLVVRATKLAALSSATEYSFVLTHANEVLIEGRFTISLAPESAISAQS